MKGLRVTKIVNGINFEIFWIWAMFYLRVLVPSFLVFSVVKSNHHLLFLAIFPDLETL